MSWYDPRFPIEMVTSAGLIAIGTDGLCVIWQPHDSQRGTNQFGEAYQAGLPNQYDQSGKIQIINLQLRRSACGVDALGEAVLWKRGRDVFVAEGMSRTPPGNLLKNVRRLGIEYRP